MTSGLMSEVTSSVMPSVMSGDKSGMASVVLPGLGWAESRRLAGAAACPPRPLGNWTRLGDGTFCSGSNPSLCLFLSRFGCLFLSLCLLFRLFVCLDVIFSVCLFICLCLFVCFFPNTSLSPSLYIHLSIYLSIFYLFQIMCMREEERWRIKSINKKIK